MRPMIVLFKVNIWEPWTTYKTVYSAEEAASATFNCLSIHKASEVKVVPQNRFYLVTERRVKYEMSSLALSLQ